MSIYVAMVTINCQDPQELALFWTQALEIEV